jgi:DNA polymerase-3 subunit delta
VRERSKKIAAFVLGEKSDPLNCIELSADRLKDDPALLMDELCALSLMGGARVVIVQDATEKLTSILSEAMASKHLAAYLIVEAEELSGSSSLRGLFERDDALAALPCYRDDGRTLDEIIRTTLRGHGLSIAPDALRYLAGNLGNDRGVTHSELAKIAVYMGDAKEVTLQDALALTDYNASETMDDICYFVACGELPQAQKLLHHMLHEGVQPVAIVRSLLRHFQRMDIARGHMENGMPTEQAVSSLRPMVFFKYVPKMKRALSLWQPRTLGKALDGLLRIEKELKSNSAPPALIISHAVQHTARLATV